MKENKPAITVEIFGEEYRIKGIKEPDYVYKLASFVDKKMREVAANTQLTSTNKIAILAALNIADELYKTREKQTLNSHQIKEKLRTLIELIDMVK